MWCGKSSRMMTRIILTIVIITSVVPCWKVRWPPFWECSFSSPFQSSKCLQVSRKWTKKCVYSFSLDRKEHFATKYFVFLYSYLFFFLPWAPLVPVVKGYATSSHIYDVICDVKMSFFWACITQCSARIVLQINLTSVTITVDKWHS